MACLRLLTALVLTTATAQEIPEFTPGGVTPSNSPNPQPLHPLIKVSIQGQHLGPAVGCTAGGGEWSEIKELCGVIVTIGGIPAMLFHVRDKRIDLRTPADVPTEGMVPIVVTRDGRSSQAVPVRFAPYPASIALSGPAYVDMPIWIDIELPDPFQHSLRYPLTISPADLGGHHLEARCNGVPPSPRNVIRALPGPGSIGTIGAGTLLGIPHGPKSPHRLPLHLLYRFTNPSQCEVRYVGYDYRYLTQKHVLVRSDWLPVQLLPLPPDKRQAWLDAMRAAEPVDPVEWISDYLPSLLAIPDSPILPFLERALHHGNDLVPHYALHALALFDDRLLSAWLPTTIGTSGPTVDLAYFVSWRRDLFQSQNVTIVQAVLPYLKSAAPLQVAGALQTLHFMKPQYDWTAHPEIPPLLDRAVEAEADRLINTRDATILHSLALYLGTWRSEASRQLLLRLIADGNVREQAEICLRWVTTH